MAVKLKEAIVERIPGAKRIGKGQRWVVKLSDGKRCLLKTNARNSLMVKTKSGDVNAEIVGFGDDVSHVLIAVGSVQKIKAWLVPIDTVESEYRANHQKWLDSDAEHSRDNTTWVLNCLEDRFLGYEFEVQGRSIGPEDARIGLATYFGTTPDKIRISVDV